MSNAAARSSYSLHSLPPSLLEAIFSLPPELLSRAYGLVGSYRSGSIGITELQHALAALVESSTIRNPA